MLFFDGRRIGTTLASAAGKFSAPLVVPASAPPGLHAVEAIGRSSALVAAVTFRVELRVWEVVG